MKEFQKAVHEGQRDGDEGQHLMLVNHVVKALKEQVKLEGSILAQLIGDIKADLQVAPRPSSLRPHTLVASGRIH